TNAMEAIMKKFMGIATAAVFGLGIFTTSAKAETIVTTNVLNVRAGANTDSEIIGKLKQDDVIETTHQVQNDWIQFEYNGK
ncbi:SH3 domain-containing protein, partial [Bacillus cereus group sp. BfR-BA-01379]|uniref:SH3 domain-containing protein n=1 Tax=Bacillus cereus group sp. BfR-BA-01379 TaxID=2920323 RepID=UPI001F58F073